MAENETSIFILFFYINFNSENFPFYIWNIHKAPAIQILSPPQHDVFAREIL